MMTSRPRTCPRATELTVSVWPVRGSRRGWPRVDVTTTRHERRMIDGDGESVLSLRGWRRARLQRHGVSQDSTPASRGLAAGVVSESVDSETTAARRSHRRFGIPWPNPRTTAMTDAN